MVGVAIARGGLSSPSSSLGGIDVERLDVKAKVREVSSLEIGILKKLMTLVVTIRPISIASRSSSFEYLLEDNAGRKKQVAVKCTRPEQQRNIWGIANHEGYSHHLQLSPILSIPRLSHQLSRLPRISSL